MSTPWWEGPLVGVDLETTGVDPETARIVTACVVHDTPGHEPSVATWLVNPGVEIPEAAAAVHGVTTERARAEGQPARAAVSRILEVLSAVTSPLVGHNVSYDFTVLDREARRYGLTPFVPHPVLDTLVLDKKADTFRRGKRTLTATCELYGVPLLDAHTAEADALAAVRLARRIADRYPDAPESASELHDLQIGWRAEQSASLEAYLRHRDPAVVVERAWPVHPLTQEAHA